MMTARGEVPGGQRAWVVLSGRTGNNLFQLALVAHLEAYGYAVSLDLSRVRRGVPAIDTFPELRSFVHSRALRATKFFPSPTGFAHPVGNLFRKLMGVSRLHLDHNAANADFVPDRVTNTAFDGYWQRQDYAKAFLPTLRDLLPELPQDSVIRVHLRRGDLEESPHQASSQYYERAVAVAQQHFSSPRTVQIITDDPTFFRTTRRFSFDYVVPSTSSARQDFDLLRAAETIIVGRSTFSWWAAAVSQASVYFPEPWDPARPENDRICVPTGWHSIPQ